MKMPTLLYTKILLIFTILVFFQCGVFCSPQLINNNTEAATTQGVISNIKWGENGKILYFKNAGKELRFDLTQSEKGRVDDLSEEEIKVNRDQRKKEFRERKKNRDDRIKNPSRGRQYMIEKSPDGKWYSICEDWNIVLENIKTGEKSAVTTGGSRKYRYGTANWVYGEELRVKHGMWWTPDSKNLIYYVFDEKPVKDFYLIGNLTEVSTTSLVEGYTKAGDPNPIVSLEIYNLETKNKVPVDCRNGEYIYNMHFTPDGKELLFNRTDRHQRVIDVMALNSSSGKTRVVVSDSQKTWQENNPAMYFLQDGERFIWETEKSGYRHYEFRHLDGYKIVTLTKGNYPALDIISVDETNGWFYFTANSDKDNPLCTQLHRVRLNGKDQERLTSQPLNYGNISISDDGNWFVAQYENINRPPSTALFTTKGELVTVLAQGPQIPNDRSEIFTFKAIDGKTDLYGILHKPQNFNPDKKYPLIVSVYGGPDSRAVYQRFRMGHPYNDLGYLVAQIDNRGTSGRGKAFKDAVYGKLGDVDIQDQADGVRYLWQRTYVDQTRVGIVGHSYGGYMAAMGILKYPDVFTAAVDKAGPTCYKNYDSIWTERYMSLPQDNNEAYEKGSCMNFVENLDGHLLIMHGLVDDNVHPTNAFQLIEALNEAKKYDLYETRFFPNNDHGFSGSEFEEAFFAHYLMPSEN